MPQYQFVCDCGNEDSIICKIADRQSTMKCKVCGREMYRKYSFYTGNKSYARPLISQSLAINPNQADEHRQLFPDVEVKPDGCLVFNDFKTHDEYLKKTGFEKVPTKTKRKSNLAKSNT